MGVTGDACAWPGPLTNPAKVVDQRLCYCNSDHWGRHKSITDQLIFQKGKKLQSVPTGGKNNRTKNTALQHTWHNINQFTHQPSTITCCDQFDRYYVDKDQYEIFSFPSNVHLWHISLANVQSVTSWQLFKFIHFPMTRLEKTQLSV